MPGLTDFFILNNWMIICPFLDFKLIMKFTNINISKNASGVWVDHGEGISI